MTVAGQKNHYNVKLLRGYGVSINLKENKICLKAGRDPFTGEQELEDWFVTQIPYRRIVISGKDYLSTEAVKLLTNQNISVILTDTYGNLITAMHKVMSSPTATRYRMAQYDTFRDPEKIAYLQKQTLKAKVESQIQFFTPVHRSEVQEAIDGLASFMTNIDKAKDKRDLLTVESRAGHLYFRNYAKLFDTKYGFISRHGGGIRLSNRYASDPINGLLNYGYTVLAGEIAKYVNGLGLDPYYGFFHVPHNSFQALVYDLIEPFRWLVEYAVYKLAVDEPQHGRFIKKDEYAWTREGRIILDDGLIRRFLELLERKFQTERPYRFKHGIKRRDGMSMCQEITIAKITVTALAEYCIGKEEHFLQNRFGRLPLTIEVQENKNFSPLQAPKSDAPENSLSVRAARLSKSICRATVCATRTVR